MKDLSVHGIDLAVVGMPSTGMGNGFDAFTDNDHGVASISYQQVSAIILMTKVTNSIQTRGIFVRTGSGSGFGVTLTSGNLKVLMVDSGGVIVWQTELAGTMAAGVEVFVLLSLDADTGVLFAGVYNAVTNALLGRVSVGPSAARVQTITKVYNIGRFSAAGGDLTNCTIRMLSVADGVAMGEAALVALKDAQIAGIPPSASDLPEWREIETNLRDDTDPTKLIWRAGAGADNTAEYL
jgi:hypothetical protein